MPNSRRAPDRAAAVLLLVLALGAGAGTLPRELSRQTRAAHGTVVTRIGEVPVLRPIGPVRTRFLDLIRRTVPPTEAVRIVQPGTGRPGPRDTRRGVPGVCGYLTVRYFWLIYAIHPRPSTCDPDTRWTAYVDVPPVDLPAGAAVYRVSPTLVLVRR